jgi:hypothetical protein
MIIIGRGSSWHPAGRYWAAVPVGRHCAPWLGGVAIEDRTSTAAALDSSSLRFSQ